MKYRSFLAAALAFLFCLALGGCLSSATLSTTPSTQPTAPQKEPTPVIPSPHSYLYIQDEQLRLVSLTDTENVIDLGSQLYSIDETTHAYEGSHGATLALITRLSADGSRILYPQNVAYNGCDIYYQDLSAPEEAPILIACGLSVDTRDLFVNEDFDQVTYLVGENLYQHDLTNQTLIDTNVCEFSVSADGKTMWYRTWDDALYLKKDGQDARLVSTGVTYAYSFWGDTTLFYLKGNIGGDLYKQQGDEPEELIGTNVNMVVHSNGDGTCYYYTESQERFSYLDLLEDDLNDKAQSAVYLERMQDYSLESPFHSLYYYNGTESILISDAMLNWSSLPDGETISYMALESPEMPTWKLSEYISEYENIFTLRDRYLDANECCYVVTREDVAKVEYEDMENIDLHLPSGGRTPYMVVYHSANSMDLYRVTMEGCQITAAELVDTDIFCGTLVSDYWQTDDEGFLYFKNSQERTDETDEDETGNYAWPYYTGTMYLDGVLIDENVYQGSEQYHNGKLYYMVGWNNVLKQGTLKVYDGETTQVVADGVNTMLLVDNGDLLIKRNYNDKTSYFDLWVLSDGQLIQLAEDVIAMMNIYDDFL